MPYRKRILLVLIILALGIASCNFPGSSRQPDAAQIPGQTPAPGLTLPPPATPSPSPSPTPLPAVRIEQADNALFVGDTERARQEYQAAALVTEDVEIQASALLGIGRSFYQERKFDLAIDTLKSLINEHPANRSLANGYYFLAEAHFARQEYLQAAEAYGKYLELNPGILDEMIGSRQAEAYMAAAMYPEAIQSFQTVIQSAGTADTSQYYIRIGQAYSAQNDLSAAIRTYLQVYESTTNDFYKAQVNFLAGQAYLGLGFPEQAYARFQDSVNNYPRSYDSYSGLVILVNSGQQVDDLNRGLVNYFARQYGYSAEALLRYMRANPEHDGTPHHYRALALRASDEYQAAIAEWQELIQGHIGDRFYSDAWKEIAYTQWAFLDDYEGAAATLKNYVALIPNAPDAASALYSAGRILERANRLTPAAETWARLLNEYPSAEISPRGQFMAGITYYRLKDYPKALDTFQRQLVLSTNPTEQAAALLWIGKVQEITGDRQAALGTWQQASLLDPNGYYSERSRELLEGLPPYHTPATYDLGIDIQLERGRAEDWLRATFTLAPETDLSGLGGLQDLPVFQRGMAMWELGLYQLARGEFETLREQISQDPVLTYRFMNEMLVIGTYRPAVFASRQILNLAGMNNLQTLSAPRYFNLIRFGTYYYDAVIQEANETGFHPLFLFSLIRQESFYESFVYSGAGARGLMQIMPATGQELATRYNWPPDYTEDDLLNPLVNVRLGAKYLANQRDYFNGDIYVALAAYNGGPGNALIWSNIAGGDQDLFLEVIRFEETQNYIRNIAEFLNLYRIIYERR